MIELIEITKVFNAGKVNEFKALKGISAAIEDNKITVLKGPSGSGKSTLLSIVGCMSRPTSGRIKLYDREITSLPERFLAQIRRKTFGFIFQHFNLIKGISVIENVMIPAYPTGERHTELKDRAMELLTRFRISSKANQHVEFLSGGEKQRTAIARALINEPSIVIADEPTAHLDTALSLELLNILENLKKKWNKTIIITTHDPLVFETNIAERVLELRDGEIVHEETVQFSQLNHS
ncbi:MAG TPA: ABC transporter ATP-binding protein [Thermodesulfovibrionia bacterium]|nr:ABC transporter ATP-binding protein [Thermodesulfovibrionia bacterium]